MRSKEQGFTFEQMNWLQKIFNWCLEKNSLLLVISGLLFVICLPGPFQIQQRVAVKDFLDPDLKTTQDLKEMNTEFGEQEILIANLRKENWTSKDLCKIEVAVNEVLFKNSQIETFTTPLQFRLAKTENDKLNFPRIVPNVCEVQTHHPLSLLSTTPWADIYSDKSAKDYTVTVQFKPVMETGAFGSFDPDRIRSVMDDFKKIDSEFTWSGGLAHEFFNYEGSTQNTFLNLMALVLMLVGIRIFLGTWKAGFIYFLTLALTYTLILAGMAVAGHSLGPLEACLFLLIMISALEDFVFLSCSMLQHKSKSMMEHFKNYLEPSFYTSLTTTIGFGSLMISDLEMIRRFGFWASLASIIEWVVLFLIFPGLILKLQKRSWLKSWVAEDKTWFPTFLNFSQKWIIPKKWILVSFGLLCIYPIISPFNLTQTPTEMFPPDHQFQTSINQQLENKGWIATSFFKFGREVSPQIKAQAKSQLEQSPLVHKVLSFDSLLDFSTSQINDPGTKDWIETVFKTSTAGSNLKLDSGSERWIVFLKSTETKKLNQLRLDMAKICPDGRCSLVGEYIGFAELSQVLIKTLFESLFVSLFLVGLLIFFIMRKFEVKGWWPIHSSILWGPLFLVTCIQISGFTINFVTCIVASLVVGLAGDNAIQYLFSGRGLNHQGIDQEAKASIICMILMSFLSLVLIFSYFQPPRSLGILLSIGFIGNLIGDLWVLKGLLPKNPNQNH